MCIDCANVLALLRAIGHPKWFSAGGVLSSHRDRPRPFVHQLKCIESNKSRCNAACSTFFIRTKSGRDVSEVGPKKPMGEVRT